ncbi:molybdopterin converting factor small subunit [Natronocella acetinitrilica]|jgi:sulfur-carrier protein|uniref:Molybdopterin converting factor small subunit n=1 Tax=Natronocella acetinitrilica TaxID=414046 RepID=A0AAE3G154_9GAMM|nr:MoaD/ThiS family protein [Natronocella acetinitrilica]MCP1673650.1 molybdopterin converting factor small subunit [Natronocella acetinitrilica]
MLVVEFYGVLQQAAGGKRLELSGVEPGCTVGDALEHLRQEVPALEPHLPRLACAQGDRLVRRNQAIDTDKPLVLLPPVSGGSHGLREEAP